MNLKMLLPSPPNSTYDCICRDKGPKFANALGIEYLAINESISCKDGVFIIDTCFYPEDLEILEEKIKLEESSFFFFLIVDNHPTAIKRNTASYKAAHSWCKKYKNVFMLCVYSMIPTFQKNLELREVPAKKCLFINYPYNDEYECSLNKKDFLKRKDKISLTGRINNKFYKYRLQFFKNVGKNFWEQLGHPGGYYKRQLKHKVVGKRYIDYLSGYKLMLVTPSIYGYELLKYSECAEAGCVPVGICPSTLPNEIMITLPNDVKKWESKVKDIVKFPAEDLYNMAIKYRNFFTQNRSKIGIKEKIHKFISEI